MLVLLHSVAVVVIICRLLLFLGCCDPNIVAGMESNRKKMMTSFLVPDYVPFLFFCIFLIDFDSCRAEPILNLNATEPKNRISP